MKIAYVASSEFGCPPPPNQIQAALWICQQVMEGETRRGHETIYIGVDGTTAKVSKIISMGPAFFDINKYDEWVQLSIAEKDQTLSSYQMKLQIFLIETLRNLKVDLVHYHTSPPVFMLPFAGEVMPPKLQTLHDPLYPSYKPIFDLYSDLQDLKYVSISNAQRRPLPNLPYAGTVYNGIPVEQYAFESKPKKQLLFLGRIKKIKGIKDCLTASQKSGFPLVIAGRTAMTEKTYMDTEITPFIDGVQIRHVGVVGLTEKVKLIKESSALLFPINWEEPFGLVMVEAMACGTPVIVYNRGSVSEIVKDGVTGFIIDQDGQDRPGKGSWIIKKQGVEGLVEAIHRIGEIDRSSCRKHVEQFFSMEKMVENYEKIYRKIIST